MKKMLILGVLSIFVISSNYAQTRIPVKAGENTLQLVSNEKSGLSLVNNVAYIDVQLEKRTQGENVELIMTGYGNTFNVGNPDLPALSRLIEVPADATVEVNVIGYSEVTLKLSDYDINKPIAPAQESVSKSADPDKIPYVKNNQVYATNAWFSNPIATFQEVGIMRGVRIGRIEINPLAYNAVTGELKIFNDLKIQISFNNANYSKSDELKARYNSPAFNGLLSGLLNYSPAAKDLHINSTPMKFVIVSDPMFEETLAPFVAWKKKQGFNTILRFTNETEVGNTTTSIKAYLQGLYTGATEENPAPSFVMLVGDFEQIPAFNGASDSHKSDLYYTTYDGSSDRISDVNFGRMSAKNVGHLQPLIEKTLLYEQFQMADPSYLVNGLQIAGVDAGNAPLYGNGAVNYIVNTYFNAEHGINSTNIFYPASDGAGVPAQIIQLVNSGLAWGNYTAHCSPSGWADPSFEIGAISSLTNDQKYGLYIGNCCQSSQFVNDVCFAEAITRAANKGAIGYIGGTNSTYWSEDYWWATGFGTVVQNPVWSNFGPGSYDALFHEHLTSDAVYSTTQGQLNIAGCLAVEESTSSRKLYYWEIYHLMGDPTLIPFIGPTPAMTPEYLATVPMGMNTITVSNLPVKAHVALTDNGTIKAVAYANESGTAELVFEGFTVPTTADLVISAPFYRPFIQTIDIIPSNSPFVVYFGAVVNDAQANNNGALDFDEEVTLNIDLRNVGTVNATNVTATLTSESPYVTILDEGVHAWGNINAETTVNQTSAFRIKVAKNVPDQTKIAFAISATDGVNEPWVTTFTLTANAPLIANQSFQFVEVTGNENGRIDAGEVIRITVPVINNGHATGFPMTAMMFSNLVAVEVANVESEGAALAAGQSHNFVFDITTGADIPVGTPLTLSLDVATDVFSFTATQTYSVGLMLEAFESGSFGGYNWTQGSTPWTIVNTGAYEGTYAAKSGTITHSQTSSLSVTMDVPSAGNISFYRKTDSEANYDKLFFKINGTTMNGSGWSGDLGWEEFTYPVTAGSKTFAWEYTKDGSVSTGGDAAWIDMIIFPGAAAITNTAPYFTSTDITTGTTNELYSATLTASDAQNDQLTFSAVSLPEWMSLTDNGDNTATLSGTPPQGVVSAQFVVAVSDGMFVTNKVINVTIIVGIPTNTPAQLAVYPNPSEGKSTLTYNLLKGERVVVELVNVAGQTVRTVINQPMTSGDHQTTINFEGLASGVYMVRLTAGDVVDNLYVVVK